MGKPLTANGQPMDGEPTATGPRMGPPLGNRNAARHGLRAWCSVKRLPPGAGAIRRQLYAERDEIHAAVVSSHGEISLTHAALVQSAIRHSGRASLLERWLRVEPGLSVSERIAILKEIGAATDSRDRCLERLDLKTDHESFWSAVDARGGFAAGGDA